MDYILNSQLLNLSSSSVKNNQYYKWMEHQRIQKNRIAQKKLKNELLQIDSFIPTEKQKKTKNQTCVYQKNKRWKESLQKKNAILKEQIEIQRNTKPEEYKQKNEKSLSLEQKNHFGPIKAWNQRFQMYIKKKNNQFFLKPNVQQFTPEINQQSRKMTISLSQKVETRLLEYGQRLKKKKNQLELEYFRQQKGKKSIQVSNVSQKENVFQRLYKDGQRQNYEKNNVTSIFTFAPEINTTSRTFLNKISQSRKPLYYIKEVYQISQSTKKNESKNKKIDFVNFLQRNFLLLQKKQKKKNQKIQEQFSKQQKELAQCTFTPQINRHSEEIFHNKFIAQNQKAQQAAFLNSQSLIDNLKQNQSNRKKQKKIHLNLYEVKKISTQQTTQDQFNRKKIESSLNDSLQNIQEKDLKNCFLKVEQKLSSMLKKMTSSCYLKY